MAEIFLDHVTKVFSKNVIAVNDITLKIHEGMLVGLLGPSGCGKTTTLRLIAGLEKPDKGKIYFNNLDVTKLGPRHRNIAMVFQFPVLYPTISVYENIALALRANKLQETEIRKSIKEIAEIMGIANYLEEKPGKLDMGTKQKVCLAKALIKEPEVFLLDEPLTVVEPKLRNELRTKLKEIQLKFRKSMIYVTHDQTEVMTLADKIAVMKDGKILQYDTPENLYYNPANTFVGWFIGSPGMNFIECSLEFDDNKCTLISDSEFKYDVTDIVPFESIKQYKKVILGIRPEHIIPGSGEIIVKCTHIEHAGSRYILYLEMADKILKAKVPLSFKAKVGDKIPITFLKEKIILFDLSTGNRIV
ncbi:MAG: ABC transporter ATP-binding protein [Candidatus Methanomethylicaceae archaeon]